MIGQDASQEIPAGPGARQQRWRVPAVCLGLVAITFAVFGQVARFEFVNYDDGPYVSENPVVTKGLTLRGAQWALTYGDVGHWHPLTWLSHMLDCQVYGLWAGGHHLTSVALQAVAAVLLFLALREMTGSLWRSAFVAAVFAIHPLRAESVAWVAERKDVLSGVFFMLALWAYGRYARQPSRGRYAAVVGAYALGLLSKNTLVTLPFVLLLLDWWPLRRWNLNGAGAGKGTPLWGLVKEKVPLFLLSAGSCAATFFVPEKVYDSARVPFFERVGNAVVSYGIYLRQMIFPTGLAIPYPIAPNGLPVGEIVLAAVVLAAISAAVLACWRARPYLLVGWLWYLGMLAPMIGIIQFSYYAHADRYTYLPGIGVVLGATWWVAEWRASRAALGGLMAGLIALFMVCAWQQAANWKDSVTLWSYSLACDADNDVALNNLGMVLMEKGRMKAAAACFQRALQIQPSYALACNNLGVVFLRTGKVDAAIPCFRKALQIRPDFAGTHDNLAKALVATGKVDEAIAHYRWALQIRPDFAEACNDLGEVLLQTGKVEEAVAQYQRALQINPGLAIARKNLDAVLLQKSARQTPHNPAQTPP